MSDAAPLKPRVCCRTGCSAKAVALACLLVRPKRRFGDGQMSVILDMPLCADHAATINVKALLSDEMWAATQQVLKTSGKAAPDRGRTAAAAVLIDDAPAFFRDRYEPALPPAQSTGGAGGAGGGA